MWYDGMISDNKPLAYAAVHRSGGLDFCEQIGQRLDGSEANIHWTTH